MEKKPHQSDISPRISRREFLKFVGVTTTAALLSGCTRFLSSEQTDGLVMESGGQAAPFDKSLQDLFDKATTYPELSPNWDPFLNEVLANLPLPDKKFKPTKEQEAQIVKTFMVYDNFPEIVAPKSVDKDTAVRDYFLNGVLPAMAKCGYRPFEDMASEVKRLIGEDILKLDAVSFKDNPDTHTSPYSADYHYSLFYEGHPPHHITVNSDYYNLTWGVFRPSLVESSFILIHEYIHSVVVDTCIKAWDQYAPKETEDTEFAFKYIYDYLATVVRLNQEPYTYWWMAASTYNLKTVNESQEGNQTPMDGLIDPYHIEMAEKQHALAKQGLGWNSPEWSSYITDLVDRATSSALSK